MKRKLAINEVGGKLLFKGRVLRTPVTLMVTDADFKLIELQMRSQGMTQYEFVVDEEEYELPPELEKEAIEQEMKIADQKKEEQKTILERLSSEE